MANLEMSGNQQYFHQGVHVATREGSTVFDRSRFSPTKPNGEDVDDQFIESYDYGFEWGWAVLRNTKESE